MTKACSCLILALAYGMPALAQREGESLKEWIDRSGADMRHFDLIGANLPLSSGENDDVLQRLSFECERKGPLSDPARVLHCEMELVAIYKGDRDQSDEFARQLANGGSPEVSGSLRDAMQTTCEEPRKRPWSREDIETEAKLEEKGKSPPIELSLAFFLCDSTVTVDQHSPSDQRKDCPTMRIVESLRKTARELCEKHRGDIDEALAQLVRRTFPRNVCRVYTRAFTREFERVSESEWVATEDNSGPLGYTSVVSRLRKRGLFDWEYRETGFRGNDRRKSTYFQSQQVRYWPFHCETIIFKDY